MQLQILMILGSGPWMLTIYDVKLVPKLINHPGAGPVISKLLGASGLRSPAGFVPFVLFQQTCVVGHGPNVLLRLPFPFSLVFQLGSQRLPLLYEATRPARELRCQALITVRLIRGLSGQILSPLDCLFSCLRMLG